MNDLRIISALLLILCGAAQLVTAPEAWGLSTKAKSKFGIALKIPKKSKGNFPNLNYCARIGGKWLAAQALKSGTATLAPGNSKAQNKICEKEGKKFRAGGLTYKKVSSASLQLPAAHSAASFVRLGATGTAYPIVFGVGSSSAQAIFELQNGYTILELDSPPRTVAGESCYYARIAPSGSLGCLSDLKGISGTSALDVKGGQTFQADTSNNVYFVGATDLTQSSLSLFKLSSTGTLSVVYSVPDLATISGFRVLSAGGIVVSLAQANSSNVLDPGYDEAPVLIYLSSSAVEQELSADTRTLSGNGLNWIAEFADGRAHVGLTNYSGSQTLSADTAQIYRVASSLDSLEHYLTPKLDPICTGLSDGPVCGYGASIIRAAVSTSSETMLVAQEPLVAPATSLSSAVIRVYPNLGVLSLAEVSNPSGMAGLGSTLVIAGKNGSGQGVLISYNTTTLTETVLKTGILVGDGPYYCARSASFLAYGTDLSVTPPKLYAIQIPVSSSGALGTLVATALSSTSTVSFCY
ncbi:MAG: hypothetical protein K1X79_13565 [Oligoflexia bacterium]|nr:hypothetical protein [Oligoflexia bacterium]